MSVGDIGIGVADGAKRVGAASARVAVTAHPVSGNAAASSPGKHVMPGEPRLGSGTLPPANLDLRVGSADIQARFRSQSRQAGRSLVN